MERKEVALGKAAAVESGSGILMKPKSLEERIRILESTVDTILGILSVNGIMERRGMEEKEVVADQDPAPNINGDGVPIGIHLLGSSSGQVHVLAVNPDAYYIGNKPYKSLSAAATAARGSRVSGWTFWKLPDGRTAKEAFLSLRKRS